MCFFEGKMSFSLVKSWWQLALNLRQNDHAEEVVNSRILQERLRSEAHGSEQLFTPDEARAGGEANHDHSTASPDGKTLPLLSLLLKFCVYLSILSFLLYDFIQQWIACDLLDL